MNTHGLDRYLGVLEDKNSNVLKKEIMGKNYDECLKDIEVNVNESAGWLVHGNNSARTEGMCCVLQDQNLFFDNGENKCNHCNSAKKTVDHLATRCGRMLNSSYLRRHNEVVKCLHFHLCRQYGIRKTKKLKTYSVQSVVANEVVEIRVDTTISTDTAVSNNKPDIFVHDKMRNTITLIEVGITSQNFLKQVEVEKFHKYDFLANELGAIHRAKVKIIPFVLTWDGIVSRIFKSHLDSIAVEDRVAAYIQTLGLRKTLESMQVETRHGISVSEEEQAVIECQPKDNSESGIRVDEDLYVPTMIVGHKRRRSF
ncbi:uncharacterized protein LOC115228368 [Octopus sinensis]|uniref:Uncharacterized protein LOC115228368 n=1 Tax=Octopus sinensis TaxID=2607531 RepID=A0A6P7TZY6_9MOLL|nr:uncharacterized protein LOC115228368 [Octopus sinensis]